MGCWRKQIKDNWLGEADKASEREREVSPGRPKEGGNRRRSRESPVAFLPLPLHGKPHGLLDS